MPSNGYIIGYLAAYRQTNPLRDGYLHGYMQKAAQNIQLNTPFAGSRRFIGSPEETRKFAHAAMDQSEANSQLAAAGGVLGATGLGAGLGAGIGALAGEKGTRGASAMKGALIGGGVSLAGSGLMAMLAIAAMRSNMNAQRKMVDQVLG